MLMEFFEKLEKITRTPVPFDPAVLDDPLALKTAWDPANPGGANFRTHRLVQVAPGRMEFRCSFFARVFSISFLLAGIIIPGILAAAFLAQNGLPFKLGGLFALLLGIVFVRTGIVMLRSLTAPIVFDQASGSFRKGRSRASGVIGTVTPEGMIPLARIRALQIIAEYCSGNETTYYSYELNLVLDDASRVNVVDHGNLAKLREDVAQLAASLGKPVWDATPR